MFKRPNTPKSRIDTLVGAGTTITGDVVFSGGLRVDGEIRGNIRAVGEQTSTLVVSEHARIEGEIAVSHVVINGTVLDPVVSSGFLELQAKARVTGDVEYNSIEIHLGAIVQGKLVHTGQTARTVELKLASSN